MSEIEFCVDLVLESDDGEGCQLFIELEQLFYEADDDLSVDELQAIVFWCEVIGVRLEQFFFKSLVYNAFYIVSVFYKSLYISLPYQSALCCQLKVDEFSRTMEDVAEDTVVNLVIIVFIGLLQVGQQVIVELQGTAHVFTDSEGIG